MADGFDPYYTWLGIRPEESAGGGADHYRLLGVQRFEDNPDAIANAMDQRMHFLRTLQVGKRAAQSQALLNEISVAAGCLLDAHRKAEYDRQLRAQLASHLAVPEALPASLVAAAVPAPMPPPPPQRFPLQLIVGAGVGCLDRPAADRTDGIGPGPHVDG